MAFRGQPLALEGKSVMVKDPKPIMETNSSSIVSKRSVEQKFYEEPHVLRYFVRKRKNRSPLINRGYWLRMKCVEHTIKKFCLEASKPALVINLGAGFDALPFRLLSNEPELCQSTIFIDVDYEELLRSKVDTILNGSGDTLRSLLGAIHSCDDGTALKLVTDKYWALACDLHDLAPMQQMVADYFNGGTELSILMVSEVATCYMDPTKVDRLISWAVSLEDVTFCLLEQHLPNGPQYPFAKTMLQHFSNLRSPLRGIHMYRTMADQMTRFRNLGWDDIRVRSLWQIWCETGQNVVVSAENRRHLDDTEPFDEWEEFALFACHYFLLLATSRSTSAIMEKPQCSTQNGGDDSPLRISEKIEVNPDLQDLAMPSRRFGALYQSAEDGISYHGGYGTNRTNSTITLALNANVEERDSPGSADIGPRMCHTVTRLNERFDLFLIGGRTAPDQALSDCWLRVGGRWGKVTPLPIPLYRHCALKINLRDGNVGVLVHGGRTSKGRANSETFLWHFQSDYQGMNEGGPVLRHEKWHKVQNVSKVSCRGRFAAMMGSPGDSERGILMGGLEDGGTPARPSTLQWHLFQNSGGWFINFEPFQEDNVSFQLGKPYLARFGASLVFCPRGITIIGGISEEGIPSRENNVLFLRSPTQVFDGINYATLQPMKIGGADIPSLLVGHSAIWNDGKIILVGGGAICFSFGTHHNHQAFYIEDGRITRASLYSVKEVVGAPVNGIPPGEYPSRFRNDARPEEVRPGMVRSLRSITATEFLQTVRDAQPVILSNLEFGSCVQLWTPEYLIEKIGADRIVTIHRADTSHMSFQPGRKNFKYVDCPFGQFIASAMAGGKEYFRALSNKDTSTPANLESDFPEIASDFSLPLALDRVSERRHSSVLRISGPVSMWLHYDVLANILIQVRGSKTLMLFPPSDIRHLNVPPGSSTSNLDVSMLLAQASLVPPHTNPWKVTLKPGDAVFIPPLWLHCATPDTGMSIAVNVFFRDLDEGYAAGRDAYGNRDVQAYEDGRKDIAKIVKRFNMLPTPMADFYLQRLIQELEEHAARVSNV